MSPDLDEFHDAPSSLIAAVAERHGGFVLGHMVDRAAFDWKLRSTRASIPLWTQYPRRCAATAERLPRRADRTRRRKLFDGHSRMASRRTLSAAQVPRRQREVDIGTGGRRSRAPRPLRVRASRRRRSAAQRSARLAGLLALPLRGAVVRPAATEAGPLPGSRRRAARSRPQRHGGPRAHLRRRVGGHRRAAAGRLRVSRRELPAARALRGELRGARGLTKLRRLPSCLERSPTRIGRGGRIAATPRPRRRGRDAAAATRKLRGDASPQLRRGCVEGSRGATRRYEEPATSEPSGFGDTGVLVREPVLRSPRRLGRFRKPFLSKPSPPRPLLSAHPRRVQDHQANDTAALSKNSFQIHGRARPRRKRLAEDGV